MDKDLLIVRWATFLSLVLVATIALIPRVQGEPRAWFGYALLILAAAALLTFAIEASLRYITRSLIRPPSNGDRRQDWLVRFNSELFAAQEPADVIMATMRTGRMVMDAKGASFVAFDEWDRSVPFLKDGVLPNTKIEAVAHLVSTRQACRQCTTRQAEGACILLEQGNKMASRVYCLPLRENGREIGVVNYYGANPEATADLELVASCAESALDSLRQRDKELVALRHLQSSTFQNGIPDLLRELSEPLRASLGAESTFFWLPDGLPGGLTTPILISRVDQPVQGLLSPLPDSFLFDIWKNIGASQEIITFENLGFGETSAHNAILAAPLSWRGGPAEGLLLLQSRLPLNPSERQRLMIQAVAGEAALIVQNSRLMMQVQYQSVLNERTRLAREIHDGLAQTLAFLKIQASQMKHYLENGKIDRLEEALSANYQTLTEAYRDIRLAIDDLRMQPETTTNDWLTRIFRDFETSSGVTVDATGLRIQGELSPTSQIQLIRIVQEALNNIRKHARANAVVINTYAREDFLILEIQDNGQGFDSSHLELASHYGILGMKERAGMLGGQLEINSQIGKGTQLKLIFPVTTGVAQ